MMAAGPDPAASLLINTEDTGGGSRPLPAAPRPMMVDFRFFSEQQLQANLAAATNPGSKAQDPFVAAFVSVCLGE